MGVSGSRMSGAAGARLSGAIARRAVELGVRRLVLLSSRGEDRARPAEEAPAASGARWTVLRCAWLDQNFSEGPLLDQVRGPELTFAAPAGLGEPFIDVRGVRAGRGRREGLEAGPPREVVRGYSSSSASCGVSPWRRAWVRSRDVTSSGGRNFDQRSGNSEGMSGSPRPSSTPSTSSSSSASSG